MLEKQIITWINGERDFHAGLYLLKHIHPEDPILFQTKSPEREKELFLKLGRILRSKAASDVSIGISEIITAPATGGHKVLVSADQLDAGANTPEAPEEPQNVEITGLKAAQRLAIEAGNHRKNRNYYHSLLHNCTTDDQRKKVMLDIDRETDAIRYKNKLIKQLDSGEITEVPAEESVQVTDFSVPEDLDSMDLYNVDVILRRYRSTRSKRDAKLQKLAAAGKQQSPEYQQAAADYEQLDNSIKALDEHKKIRQKSSAAV